MTTLAPPPPLTDMPAAPDRAHRDTFEARAVAWAEAQKTLVKEERLALAWVRNAIDAQAADVAGAAGAAASAQESAIAAAQSAQDAVHTVLAAQQAAGIKGWKEGQSYAAGDIVFGKTQPGMTFRCIVAVTGSTPPEQDAVHWVGIGQSVGSILKTSPDAGAATADFAPRAGSFYDVDTTGGSLTLTLPASPGFGDWIGINDLPMNFRAAPLTIKPAPGDWIEGQKEPLVMDVPWRGVIVYRGGARGWIV